MGRVSVRLSERLWTWLGFAWRREQPAHIRPARGAVTHVVILDGTMSSLQPGDETNAGLTYNLLTEGGRRTDLHVWYEPGIQWRGWRNALDVIEGRGINRQIRRVYGALASHYRPGDRIYLFGYSRGAYAVRSLAGVIGTVGLLRTEWATERSIREIYRAYRDNGLSEHALNVLKGRCHKNVPIRMIGCWDTVKSLGLRAPIVWRWSEKGHYFHNHNVTTGVKAAFHALALNETRVAYAPVMWSKSGEHSELVQMWFRGTHGDIGGQLFGSTVSRPLSNIPLIWMLGKAEAQGLVLPDNWRGRFPTDPHAPSAGSYRGWGKFFISRRRRKPGAYVAESVHHSVPEKLRPPGLPVSEDQP